MEHVLLQGFVQDNNIYWLDSIEGNLHTITDNGKENELFNGVPDWVYEGKYHVTFLNWSQTNLGHTCLAAAFAHGFSVKVLDRHKIFCLHCTI